MAFHPVLEAALVGGGEIEAGVLDFQSFAAGRDGDMGGPRRAAHRYSGAGRRRGPIRS